jgi:hypothetical protein
MNQFLNDSQRTDRSTSLRHASTCGTLGGRMRGIMEGTHIFVCVAHKRNIGYIY